MKLTKEMLINWIDRPPSNSDLDLINYIIGLQNNRDKATEILENHQNNLFTKEARKTLDDDVEIALNTLKGDSK